MGQADLIDAYDQFMETARHYVDLCSEDDYQQALTALEELLESTEDTEGEPLNSLIDLISNAIEAYEAQDDELMEFVACAEDVPVDVALLRTLKEHHNLTNSDFPEVGDKTMVSKVLNMKRSLQRHSIEKLAERFGIRPAMFLVG